MKPFAGNDYPTLGVEQEFHLIDPDTADLVPRMEQLRRSLSGTLAESITHEMFLSVLESRSAVARTPTELVASISQDRADLAAAGEALGVRLAAAGSHPFARWQQRQVVATEHYQWVKAHHGYIAHRLLAFGLHVHVGMRSADAAVHAMNEMRRWSYPLLALSANSPFFEGAATALASTRWHLFKGMPRTGLAPFFAGFTEIESLYEKLRAAGDVLRPGDLWWALRPQPPLGTLEFRLFDLPTDVRRIGALAAICQAACAFYQERFEAGEPAARLQDAYLEQNHWKALRYDLDARIVDPATGELLTMRQQLSRLLELVAPKAAELGTTAYLGCARRLLSEPTESQWQVEAFQTFGGDLRLLELEIARRTVLFEPLPDSCEP